MKAKAALVAILGSGIVPFLAVALVALPANGNGGKVQCREGMTYLRVRQVLLAAYPDLPTDLCKLRITFSTPMNQLSEEFTNVQAEVNGPLYFNPTILHGKHVSQVQWTTLVGAYFSFDASWRLGDLLVSGRWVHDSQIDKIVQTLGSHPKWGAKEAIDLLRRAGAKYTPDRKEAFISHIPVKALGTALNIKLAIRSVEFVNWTGEDHAALFWSVYFEGSSETLDATFEPFDGRLTSLLVMPKVGEQGTNEHPGRRPDQLREWYGPGCEPSK
jgi:hypothetical protein